MSLNLNSRELWGFSICVHACVCEDVGCPLFYLFLWDLVSHWSWNSLIWQNWLPKKPRRAYLYSPASGNRFSRDPNEDLLAYTASAVTQRALSPAHLTPVFTAQSLTSDRYVQSLHWSQVWRSSALKGAIPLCLLLRLPLTQCLSL